MMRWWGKMAVIMMMSMTLMRMRILSSVSIRVICTLYSVWLCKVGSERYELTGSFAIRTAIIVMVLARMMMLMLIMRKRIMTMAMFYGDSGDINPLNKGLLGRQMCMGNWALAWVILVQVATRDWNRLDSCLFYHFGPFCLLGQVWKRSRNDVAYFFWLTM